MSRPLTGHRVLVTRAAAQAQELVALLEAAGATAIVLPSIEYQFLEGQEAWAMDRALRRAGEYDAVIVTSPRGSEAIEKRLEVLGPEVRQLVSGRRLIAVGSATAAALARALRQPDLIPGEFSASGILQSLGDVSGQRFLLLRADLAKEDLPEGLVARGAQADDVVAYRIVKSRDSGSDALAGPAPDFITFASSSAVHNTFERLNRAGMLHWMSQSRVVCIGPVTAKTLTELGYPVAAIANPSTSEGLVSALQVLSNSETGASLA